jgi:phycocyanobilin:ferredoxin oxidoreductase
MQQRLSTTWNAVPGMIPLVIPKPYSTMSNSLMTIRNECLTSHTFRKVHIEYATSGDLDIVHHVAFPHYTYDIPIFGIDMIRKNGIPTMAIADVSGECAFIDTILDLQDLHQIRSHKKRQLPEWGLEIFSDQCMFLDAPDPEVFEAYVADLLGVYIEFALHQRPGMTHRKQEQLRYCTHQLRNTRTRHVLAKAFGTSLADGYMQDVMFSW